MQKGDKGLPGAGRPKGSVSHSTKFKAFLSGREDYVISVNGEEKTVKMTREEILMYRLYEIAQQGDLTKYGESQGVSVAAIKEIHDRAHGKAPQEMNLGMSDNAVALLPKIEISFRPPTDDAPPESEQKAERPKE